MGFFLKSNDFASTLPLFHMDNNGSSLSHPILYVSGSLKAPFFGKAVWQLGWQPADPAALVAAAPCLVAARSLQEDLAAGSRVGASTPCPSRCEELKELWRTERTYSGCGAGCGRLWSAAY